MATEALQLSTLLLPPPNRRRLQLLMRLMARVCQNPHLPPLNDTIMTRTLVQMPVFVSVLVLPATVQTIFQRRYRWWIFIMKLEIKNIIGFVHWNLRFLEQTRQPIGKKDVENTEQTRLPAWSEKANSTWS